MRDEGGRQDWLAAKSSKSTGLKTHHYSCEKRIALSAGVALTEWRRRRAKQIC